MRIHESADEFLAIAEPVYRRDPITNTVELTLLRSAMPDDVLLLSMWQNSDVVGVALQTPPYPLACNGIPVEHADAVASDLMRMLPDLSGVRGSRENAVAFADAWRSHGGPPGTVVLDERLYRLGDLQPPTGVAGAPRWAEAADRDILADRGDRFLLWDVAGAPVGMALLRAAAAGVSRIGPVFTPTNRRGSGYGSAVTAAASQAPLDRGDAEVVLFADLANPTSNAIYQKLGYAPVTDCVRVDFRTVD